MRHQTEGDRLAHLTKAVEHLILGAHEAAEHHGYASACRQYPCVAAGPYWNAARMTEISEKELDSLKHGEHYRGRDTS